MHKIFDYWIGFEMEYPCILSALDDLRVLKIQKKEDGLFQLTEKCDQHFYCDLTKDQLRCLGEEIINMANE